MKTVLEAVLYLLQHGELCHPSPLLQAGPVQPVHQCTDTSSVVVKRELHIKFCLILITGENGELHAQKFVACHYSREDNHVLLLKL